MSNTATNEHGPLLRSTMEHDGVEGAVKYIREIEGGGKLEAFEEAQRLFGPRGDAPVEFDDYIAFVRIGIVDALRDSREGGGDAAKDLANRMSFNMSADLAACWPEDELPREQRHFEAGLAAADDCIQWRDELNKPDDRKSIAWWAKGMHLFSLTRFKDALDAFRTATSLASVAPEDAPNASMTFNQLLNIGYCALTQIAMDIDDGHDVLARVRAAFDEQCSDDDPEKKEDAEFGLAQLRAVEERM